MARRTVTLQLEVDYDSRYTDGEALAVALDQLLETALSTPGVLDEYGRVEVGEFYVTDDRPAKRH